MQRTSQDCVKRWLRIHDSDPLSAVLLVVGLGISLAALVIGLLLGWEGFVSNVAAAAVLIGPGFYLTNFIVREYESRRLRARHNATLMSAVMLAAESAALADRVCAMIGPEFEVGPRLRENLAEEARSSSFQDVVLGELAAAERRLEYAIEVAEDKPASFDISGGITFPMFPIIDELIGTVASNISIPDTVLRSKIAAYGYHRQSASVEYCPNDGKCWVSRVTGLDAIQDAHLPNAYFSFGNTKSVGIGTIELFNCVMWCLRNSVAIVTAVREETGEWTNIGARSR